MSIEIPAGILRRSIRDELDGAHAAEDTHVADDREPQQRRQAGAKLRFEPRDTREQLLVLEEVEARNRHGACERIGRERVAVEERLACDRR